MVATGALQMVKAVKLTFQIHRIYSFLIPCIMQKKKNIHAWYILTNLFRHILKILIPSWNKFSYRCIYHFHCYFQF